MRRTRKTEGKEGKYLEKENMFFSRRRRKTEEEEEENVWGRKIAYWQKNKEAGQKRKDRAKLRLR